MNDRALVVAPLPACVGEGRDEVRGEGWNGLHSVHIPFSRNCRDLNRTRRGIKFMTSIFTAPATLTPRGRA